MQEGRNNFMETNEQSTVIIAEQEIERQIKPLSPNAVAAFFQQIWRKWLSAWYAFSDKHSKISKLIFQLVFYIVFSQGVTILQYLITLFLPMMFGIKLAGTEFLWPKSPMYEINGVQKYWSILGYDIAYNAMGKVVIGGGLGYFIAFEIATLIAQFINFPLQRNITFKSHGNIYWQIMWYFIGWVLISLFCNGINNLWLPLGVEYLPFAVYNILTMVSMGGISMTIFFFIFLIIFPDYNTMEKRALAKFEKLKKNTTNIAKITKAQKNLSEASKKASIFNAEKAKQIASTNANAKAMRYFAIKKSAGKINNNAKAEAYKQKIIEYNQIVAKAIKEKEIAIKLYQEVIAKD